MNAPIHLILIVLALVMFLLTGLGIPDQPRFRYLGWGLFFWCLSALVSR